MGKHVFKPGGLTAAQRRTIYTIAIAITAILGTRGILDKDIIEILNLIVSAVLGIAIGNAQDKTDE